LYSKPKLFAKIELTEIQQWGRVRDQKNQKF